MLSFRSTFPSLLLAWPCLLAAQEVKYNDISHVHPRTELRHPPTPQSDCKEGTHCIGSGYGGGSVGDGAPDQRDPHALGIYLLRVTDGGTTNLRIASYLSRERSATIVTNSPPLALALADHPELSVLMLGGNFLKEARVTTGIETIRRVESIRADLCFLGMCSLHPEVGITVGDREEAYVKQAMIGASTEVVGLISLGKMGTSLPYLVGPASRLTRLITDASDEDVLNPYRFQGIEITST